MKTKATLFAALLTAAALAAPANANSLSSGSHISNSSHMMQSSMLEGRQVIGMDGHRLGYVIAVNDRARLIELQTPGGIAVSVPESRFRAFDGQLFAINMNRNDVVALERRQTGRTVGINLDLGRRHLRG